MRIGVLSDAHGHVEAFRRALDVLERERVDEVRYLGDAVGYLPGCGVVTAIRREGIAAIRGNHEEMLLSGDGRRDGVDVYRLDETRATISDADLAELAGWPASDVIAGRSGPLVFVHGSPADPTAGYLYPDTDLGGQPVEPGSTVFAGHTHRPFVRRMAGVTFVNVGSCGLPRDHGSLGAAAVYDDATGEATILRFDITASAARAVVRAGWVGPEVTGALIRRPAAWIGAVRDA